MSRIYGTIRTNSVYRHYKGGYYKVIDIAVHHENLDLDAIVIYHACDENGVFKSIRSKPDGINEVFVTQPFFRKVKEFNQIMFTTSTPRFEFIKQL